MTQRPSFALLSALTVLLMLGPATSSLALGMPPTDASVGTWNQVEKITPNDSDEPGYFGYPNHTFVRFGSAIDIDGDMMAISSTPTANTNTDWVYIFERIENGWDQTAKLETPGDGSGGFGFALAVDEEAGILVVGDPGYGDVESYGEVRVFERSDQGHWEQTARFSVPHDPQNTNGAYYGRSVDVEGDTIVIAAPYDDLPGMEMAGSVDIIKHTGNEWVREHRLKAPDPQNQAFFGGVRSGVSLDGGHLLVGAPTARIENDDYGVGKAYLFEEKPEGEWTSLATFEAPNPGGREGPGNDAFGVSVGLDGDTIVIGDSHWDTLVDSLDEYYLVAGNTGRAYVYQQHAEGEWRFEAELGPRDSTPGEWFGYNVDLSDGKIVASAHSKPDNVPAGRIGAAYVFEEISTGWMETARLQGNDTGPGDNFGWGLSVDRETVAIGAPFDDTRKDGSWWPMNDWGNWPPVAKTGCYLAELHEEVPPCGVGMSSGSAYVYETSQNELETVLEDGLLRIRK